MVHLLGVALGPHGSGRPEHADAGRLGPVVAEAEDLVDPRAQRLAGGSCGIDLGPEARRRRVGLAAEERAEKLILGFEVAVERAGREIRLVEDVGHGRVGVAVALHDDERRIEQDAELVLGLEAPGASTPYRRGDVGLVHVRSVRPAVGKHGGEDRHFRQRAQPVVEMGAAIGVAQPFQDLAAHGAAAVCLPSMRRWVPHQGIRRRAGRGGQRSPRRASPSPHRPCRGSRTRARPLPRPQGSNSCRGTWHRSGFLRSPPTRRSGGPGAWRWRGGRESRASREGRRDRPAARAGRCSCSRS